MSATQLGARLLRLGLSSLKEQEQRCILGQPLSPSSLFGPDIQSLIEQLESASEALQQLAAHLLPLC